MMFEDKLRREDAPLVFIYVYTITLATIVLVYLITLLVYHCVFWPKILAKIKADKPVQTAKQERILRELSVGRDKELDRTQSERTETPAIERTQSADNIFDPARTVVSENASLVGDRTPPRSVQTCAATVTAAEAALSPADSKMVLQTAKEARGGKPKRWFEDDMLTGMEILQPPPTRSHESKDHKRRNKARRSDDKRGEQDALLRTGRELKKGGRTARKIRFASPHNNSDDMRTCVEKLPLLSHSIEEDQPQQPPKKTSEDNKRMRRKGTPKEDRPRSVYAIDEQPDAKTAKERKDKDDAAARKPKFATAASKSKSLDGSQPPASRLLPECKTQED